MFSHVPRVVADDLSRGDVDDDDSVSSESDSEDDVDFDYFD